MKQNSADAPGRESLTSAEDTFAALLRTASARDAAPPAGAAVTGVLAGFGNDGRTPLVTFPGQPGTAAVAARATVDLSGAHVGRPVVLMFEGGLLSRPIVLGVMRECDASSPKVEGPLMLEVDGERMIVEARKQLVLRCGKATITLTSEGKVLIDGTYVSSRSSGVQRIKGGSVQLN